MVNKTKEIGRLMPKQAPVSAKTSAEEQKQQALRAIAQQRNQIFQGILFNALHGASFTSLDDMKEAVDTAFEAANYAIERMYTPAKEEPAK